MPAIKVIKRTVELGGNVTPSSFPDPIPASFFNDENSAHMFLISARQNGQPFPFTNETVSACFLNDNNQTILINGSVVDGAACVILSDACYHVLGSFTLTISVSGAVIYECRGTIKLRSSSTGYDPTGEISIATLGEEIDEMRTATSAANTAATAASNVDIDLATGTNQATITITRPDGTQKSQTIRGIGTDDYNALRDAIEDITGIGVIQFSDPSLKQYIITNGSTVQWDTPSVSAYTNIKWAVVPCSSGDVFTVNGRGGGADRLWAFADSSKNIISVAAADASADGLVITAPSNAAYLIINDETNSQSYIGDAGRIEKLVNDASDLLKKEYPAWNVSFELGGINSSGDNFDSGVYCRTAGFVPEDVKWIRIKSPYRLLVYMYNKTTDAFIARTLYPQFDYYLRHDLYKFRFSVDDNGELLETTDINEYVDLLPYTSENHVIIQGGQLDIYMGRAHYTLKKMENASIALDTFRLYSGCFIDETGADVGYMWANSDAEGVIKLVGESDFLGGYHGDETMTSFLITIDGKKFEGVNSYWSGFFADITCVIQSTLYHAGTENPAFTKIKKLSFSEKTVTIRNTLTAVDSGMVVDRGPLAMFQCDNNDLSGTKMLTYVESNNNPGLYESPNSLPPGGSAMTENKYHTTHGMAHIRVTIGPGNPNYSAWFQNYSSQDRVKSYFESYDGQTLSANQVLTGEFSITIV